MNPSPAAAPLLEPGRRLVIAHRGASARAPENSLAAFRMALEEGADALELDVRVSRDGTPVVLHDLTLARTSNRNEPVASLPFAALQEADAGFHFSPDGGASHPWRDRGIRVPALAEVLETFPGVPLLVEIKEAAAALPLARVLRDHGAEGRCVVAGEDHHAVAPFRRPPFLAGASRRDIAALYFLPGWPARRRQPVRLYAVPMRFGPLPVPTPRFTASARALGAPVHVWTVDDPATARALWNRGVSGIITNDPAAILRVRAEPA